MLLACIPGAEKLVRRPRTYHSTICQPRVELHDKLYILSRKSSLSPSNAWELCHCFHGTQLLANTAKMLSLHGSEISLQLQTRTRFSTVIDILPAAPQRAQDCDRTALSTGIFQVALAKEPALVPTLSPHSCSSAPP